MQNFNFLLNKLNFSTRNNLSEETIFKSGNNMRKYDTKKGKNKYCFSRGCELPVQLKEFKTDP